MKKSNIIYSKDHCIISLFDNQILKQEWAGTAEAPDFKEVILTTLQAFKEYPELAFILNDLTKSTPAREDLVRWVSEEINPQLVTYGFKKMAMIYPDKNLEALMPIRQFIHDSNNNIRYSLEIRGYYSEEDGLQWLKSNEES